MIDGTLQTIDGRPALRFERRLAHSPERVWRAVTEPAELAQWFVAPVGWTPALGETFEGEGQSGEITALEAPRLLRWSWGEERYAFELAADGDGCRLVFTHVFDPSYGPAAQHAAGWETYLDRLDALLAGGALSEEDAHGPIGELHEIYAARFGQDPAPGPQDDRVLRLPRPDARGGRDDGGARLRLERRFRHPVERVWRAITEPDELAQWFPADAPMEVVESDPPHRLVATLVRRRRCASSCAPTGDRLRARLHARLRRPRRRGPHGGRLGPLLRAPGGAVRRPADGRARRRCELWPDVHERYAERFGVDPEIGRRAYAAHPQT